MDAQFCSGFTANFNHLPTSLRFNVQTFNMLSSRPVALNLDGGLYKTPGRAITKGRTENDVYHAKTVNGKGKNTGLGVGKSAIEPSTLRESCQSFMRYISLIVKVYSSTTFVQGREAGDCTYYPCAWYWSTTRG